MTFTVHTTLQGNSLIERLSRSQGLTRNHLAQNGLLGAKLDRQYIEGYRASAHEKKSSRLRSEAFLQFGKANGSNHLERRASLKHLRKVQHSPFFIRALWKLQALASKLVALATSSKVLLSAHTSSV